MDSYQIYVLYRIRAAEIDYAYFLICETLFARYWDDVFLKGGLDLTRINEVDVTEAAHIVVYDIRNCTDIYILYIIYTYIFFFNRECIYIYKVDKYSELMWWSILMDSIYIYIILIPITGKVHQARGCTE